MRGCIARKEKVVASRRNDRSIKKEEDYLVFTGVASVLLRSDFGLHAIRFEKGSLALFGQGNFLDLHQEGKGDLETHRTGKNGWLYELSEDIVTVEMTRKAYEQAKRGEPHPLTYGLLHACLKDENLNFLGKSRFLI